MTIAVILAGGLGTRLRSLVTNIPKPMAPINSIPFLSYLMNYWIGQGIKKFILSVGYKHEVITNFYGDAYQGIPIEYAVEKKQLGTGGALMLACRKIDENFLVLNGDTFFPLDLREIMKFHIEKRSSCTIAIFISNESNRYGLIKVEKDGRILGFQDQKSEIGEFANGGVYLLNSELLYSYVNNSITAPSIEKDLFPNYLQLGNRFFGYHSKAEFIDIGVPKDYIRAQIFFGRNINYKMEEND